MNIDGLHSSINFWKKMDDFPLDDKILEHYTQYVLIVPNAFNFHYEKSPFGWHLVHAYFSLEKSGEQFKCTLETHSLLSKEWHYPKAHVDMFNTDELKEDHSIICSKEPEHKCRDYLIDILENLVFEEGWWPAKSLWSFEGDFRKMIMDLTMLKD